MKSIHYRNELDPLKEEKRRELQRAAIVDHQKVLLLNSRISAGMPKRAAAATWKLITEVIGQVDTKLEHKYSEVKRCTTEAELEIIIWSN